MSVSPEEVDSMKRIMMALNGTDGNLPRPPTSTSSTIQSHETSDKDANIESMKRILMSFQNAGEGASQALAESSVYDSRVEEAIYTSRETDGVRVKNYKISIETEGKSKRYSILENGVSIASDFLLYESAYSIVKLLNDGETILSPQVRKIIHLEECYANARNEAINLKSRYKLVENTSKGDIIAAKYQQARDNALGFKATITKLMEGL